MRLSPHGEETMALFERHRNALMRYLLSFRLAQPDAEEVVQEVFLALFEHLRRGRSRANLDGWVFRVAHNLALKKHRKAQRERFVVSSEQTDPALDPEKQLAETQRQDLLLAVMKALPETDRWCLSLRAEGLRYRQIAGVLGISLGAVANSLERSLAKLSRADETLSVNSGKSYVAK